MKKLLPLMLLAPSVASAESYVPDEIVANVDVLVVMDSSPAGAGARAALADRIGGLITDLEARFPSDIGSTRVSLHVGFMTGDLGAGGTCGAGDGARLQIASTDCFDSATPLPWVIAERDRWGQTSGNFAGDAADAVRCAMPTFDDGCAIQEPLRASIAALDGNVALNDGFLRDDAVLALLYVSTQDDCSATSAAFFAGGATVLGCAEAGWSCTPQPDGTDQVHADCNARDAAGDALVRPSDIYHSLLALKANPTPIVVGVIRGEDNHVEVADGALLPSCGAGTPLAATPAFRLDTIAGGFAGQVSSVCAGDWPLTTFLDSIVSAAEPPPDGDGGYDPLCDGGFHEDDGGAPAAASGSAYGCSAGGGGGLGALFLLTLAVATARCGSRRGR